VAVRPPATAERDRSSHHSPVEATVPIGSARAIAAGLEHGNGLDVDFSDDGTDAATAAAVADLLQLKGQLDTLPDDGAEKGPRQPSQPQQHKQLQHQHQQWRQRQQQRRSPRRPSTAPSRSTRPSPPPPPSAAESGPGRFSGRSHGSATGHKNTTEIAEATTATTTDALSTRPMTARARTQSPRRGRQEHAEPPPLPSSFSSSSSLPARQRPQTARATIGRIGTPRAPRGGTSSALPTRPQTARNSRSSMVVSSSLGVRVDDNLLGGGGSTGRWVDVEHHRPSLMVSGGSGGGSHEQ
jgi:hypothetical protein